MKYRTLGKTNIQISEVGLGAWGIGGGLWQGSKDDESLRTLRVALEQGITFIDTALAYGNGHSERLIGEVLKEWKGKVSVATKIPPKNRTWPAKPGTALADAFPADYIIACTHESLKNLQVDQIDLQQFHVWSDEWTNQAEWFDTITKLKEEGTIKYFGVSINDHQPTNGTQLVQSGKVETVQVIYNIFDQSPEDLLFPVCQKNNVGVIVRVPLDEGGLTGSITPEMTFPESDFRNRYFREERKKEVQKRVQRLQAILDGDMAKSLPEVALRFCLSHPAVSTIIPGMRTESHVLSNCKISDGRALPSHILGELKKHRWVRDFYH